MDKTISKKEMANKMLEQYSKVYEEHTPYELRHSAREAFLIWAEHFIDGNKKHFNFEVTE